MIKEILLCKYGEIVLKGANRKYFEDMLCREMKKKARAYGNFDIYRAQSTIYIEPKDDEADVDGMFEKAIQAGATPLILPKTVPLSSKPEPMAIHIAFVKGPDGEELEFFTQVEE